MITPKFQLGDTLETVDYRGVDDIRTCDECGRSTSALETSLCHACRAAKGWESDEDAAYVCSACWWTGDDYASAVGHEHNRHGGAQTVWTAKESQR